MVYALTQGLIWALMTASIFAASRMYQSRKGQHRAICKDTPEMRRGRDGTGISGCWLGCVEANFSVTA